MAIIFDLGNVVLNWAPRNVLLSLNIGKSERNHLKKELFEHQDWIDLDRGRFSEETVASRVSARSGLNTTVVKQAFQRVRTSLTPIPKSVELLYTIKASGTDIYCLSNMSIENYEYIKANEFFKLFNGVVISGIEKCIKPEPKIFRIIIERYKLRPPDTLFIDDSLANIEAAAKLGMAVYHFERSAKCYSSIKEFLHNASL